VAVSSAGQSGYKIRETDVTMYSRSLGPSRAVAKTIALVMKFILLTLIYGHFEFEYHIKFKDNRYFSIISSILVVGKPSRISKP